MIESIKDLVDLFDFIEEKLAIKNEEISDSHSYFISVFKKQSNILFSMFAQEGILYNKENSDQLKKLIKDFCYVVRDEFNEDITEGVKNRISNLFDRQEKIFLSEGKNNQSAIDILLVDLCGGQRANHKNNKLMLEMGAHLLDNHLMGAALANKEYLTNDYLKQNLDRGLLAYKLLSQTKNNLLVNPFKTMEYIDDNWEGRNLVATHLYHNKEYKNGKMGEIFNKINDAFKMVMMGHTILLENMFSLSGKNVMEADIEISNKDALWAHPQKQERIETLEKDMETVSGQVVWDLGFPEKIKYIKSKLLPRIIKLYTDVADATWFNDTTTAEAEKFFDVSITIIEKEVKEMNLRAKETNSQMSEGVLKKLKDMRDESKETSATKPD